MKKELDKLKLQIRALALSYWKDNQMTCPISELEEIADKIDTILKGA